MSKSQSFDHRPQSVRLARHFSRKVLRGVSEDVIKAIELVVSELASNCIRHTNSGFRLSIRKARDEIRIEVTDQGVGEPTLRSPGPTESTGRGLLIIDMLSAAWGVKQAPRGGKTVWVRVPLPEGGGIPAAAG